MDISEGKQRFIQAWSVLGTNWGISKAMAQIHACLLTSPVPLTADDLMNHLSMSRGNVNMNTRALLEWGIIYKELKLGDRKEYFTAEKDILKVARRIALERRRREIEPLLAELKALKDVKNDGSAEYDTLIRVVNDTYQVMEQADLLVARFIQSEENLIYKMLIGLLKFTG